MRTVFAEPPPTRYDVRFRLGSVPVRIHPLFWLSTIGLSMGPGSTFVGIVSWVVAVFVSILVHELGHVAAFRRYGQRARVTLYGGGGLASPEEGGAGFHRWRDHVVVSAAGPLAGFAFAAAIVVIVLRLGYSAPLFDWTLGSGPPIPYPAAARLVSRLLFINVGWGLVNLLPVHPLDGGQIALEIAQARDPDRGAERSVRLSFHVAMATALVALFAFFSLYTASLFGYLAVMNAVVLQRRYNVGLGSLTGADWVRRRWRARQTLRRNRARATETLRRVEGLDAVETSPEVDKAVDALFASVEKNLQGRRERP
jgi:Zn-dependent protease